MPFSDGFALWWDANFDGHVVSFNYDIPDLRAVHGPTPGSNWNDETSSIIVIGGTWEFFEHINYQGRSVILGPGRYPYVGDINFPNDALSSVKRVG